MANTKSTRLLSWFFKQSKEIWWRIISNMPVGPPGSPSNLMIPPTCLHMELEKCPWKNEFRKLSWETFFLIFHNLPDHKKETLAKVNLIIEINHVTLKMRKNSKGHFASDVGIHWLLENMNHFLTARTITNDDKGSEEFSSRW